MTACDNLLQSITGIAKDPNLNTLFAPYLVAFIATFITTYISLKWFMNIMAKGNLKYFSFYRCECTYYHFSIRMKELSYRRIALFL
ncbi:Undecaprenyl-diphosphatase [Bacillus cereus Rock3-44]|nr:Undecaprenyl-diphosphatase [Bacillus cereus Rock3-44]